jgi:hypothetical protein
LDLYDISVSIYKEEFKHKPDWFKSNFIKLSWDSGDTDDILKSTLFWRLDYEWIETYHDYNVLYKKYLLSDEKDIKGAHDIWEIYENYKPISATWIYLDYWFWGKWDNFWIYIWEHDSFIDLVYFWNLRAIWKNIAFQPVQLDNYLWYTQKYIDDISEAISKSRYEWITIYYTTDSITQEKVEETIWKLTITSQKYLSNLSIHSFNWMNLLLKRNYADITKTSIWHIEERPSFDILTLPISNEKIFDDVSKNKKLIYSISASLYWRYNNSTLTLPIHKGLKELYKKELLSHHFLQSSREWLDIMEDLGTSYIAINPIEYDKIINEIFKISWCQKIELSKSWIQTKKILEQMDYKTRWLFWSKIFKISTVRHLISSMTSESSITRSDGIQKIYWTWDFDKFKSLYIERRDHSELKTSSVFDYLLSHNILRPWLEMKCKECWLKNWLSLRNIDEKWTCEYCWNEDIISTSLWWRNDWKFRLSWLFSKDNNQEWAIPVILTLLTFDSILRRNYIHGLSLNLDFWWTDKCETDIVIINQEEWMWMVMNNQITIEIWIWEIKTKSNIEQNDIDNLKYVREKLIEQWFTPYLIFAKTADNFTEEEITLFKTLKEEEISVILFTNNELEKDDFIYTDLEVRYKHPRNLFEVAENSKKIYLSD